MRITQNMLAAQVLDSIRGSEERLAKVQEQLATTKRINHASDDPQGTGLIMQLKQRISETDGYQRAAAGAHDSLDSTSASLTQVLEVLQQARDIATQGSSDTTEGSRAPLADQVNQLLGELVSEGNTQSQGQYIFGGTQTTQPPFSVNPPTGRIATVTPNPNIDGSINVQIAEGVSIQKNLPGTQAFTSGGQTVFGELITLRDNLAADVGGDHTAQIAASIDRLKTWTDQVSAAVGAVGVTVQRLNAVEARNQGDLTRFKDLLSRTQDADIAQVYVDLQKEQNAYQASLAAGAKAFQVSLMDYLR
jgi:flagellar hook-associated protein 3 FlgL